MMCICDKALVKEEKGRDQYRMYIGLQKGNKQ